MKSSILLYLIIIIGLLARSRVLVLAAFCLLLIKELELSPLAEFISNKGIEMGLVFLLMAILAPVLLVPLERKDLAQMLGGWKGLVAVIAGILATQFNGMGLRLLEEHPHLIGGIIVGSLIGIVLFRGIPVGPLMAAGIAALLLELLEKFFSFLKK